MNIHKRVKAILSTGSINTPNKDAVGVLASKLSVNRRAVVEALKHLNSKGEIDLGSSGHPHFTNYIGLVRTDFRPFSEEGRRQSKFAVNQQGIRYRSTTIGGPVITHQATLTEWTNDMGNSAESYPFGTPEPQQVHTQPSNQPAANTPPIPRKAPVRRAKLTAAQQQRRANVQMLKKLIIDQVNLTTDGIVASSDMKDVGARNLGVNESTISSYLRVLCSDRFIEFVKVGWQGESRLKLMPTLSDEQKLNAVLELFRSFMGVDGRGSLRSEAAKLMHTTPGNAEVSYMVKLRFVGAYRTERMSGSKSAVLVYVQEGPLTLEQLDQIAIKFRKAGLSQTQGIVEPPATENPAPQASKSEVVGTSVSQGAVVATQDEITNLITALVEANEAQAVQLQAQANEIKQLVQANAALEEQVLQNIEKADFYLQMAENNRMLAQTPVQPALSEDLMSRALAAVQNNASSTAG